MTTKTQKILLVTTFRLKDIESHSRCLQSWSKNPQVELLALVEDADLTSNGEQIKELKHKVDIVCKYKCTGETDSARSPKKSPSISTIFETIRLFKGYEYYAYTNADIELAPTIESFTLSKAIRKITGDKKIAFGKRRDYSETKSEYETYQSGLDFFCLHYSILPDLKLDSRAGTFQIGQVGWDYILPLSFPKEFIRFTSSLPIYHRRHATGSSADWSFAIASLVLSIDNSWLEKNSLEKHIINVSRLIARSIESRQRQNGRGKLSITATYLMSRFAFYLAIQRILVADVVAEP